MDKTDKIAKGMFRISVTRVLRTVAIIRLNIKQVTMVQSY